MFLTKWVEVIFQTFKRNMLLPPFICLVLEMVGFNLQSCYHKHYHQLL